MAFRVLILIALSALSGCLIFTGQEDWDYYTPCDLTFANLELLQFWVWQDIKYATDQSQYGREEYWATPAETLKSKRGDCDDQALLFAYIAYRIMGIRDVEVLFVYDNPSKSDHVMVRAQGSYWLEKTDDWTLGKSYNYGQAMWIAEFTHASYPGARMAGGF